MAVLMRATITELRSEFISGSLLIITRYQRKLNPSQMLTKLPELNEKRTSTKIGR